jgi:hypothetical protein
VSAALQKLALAASGHLGHDCYVHAELGGVLLADQGVKPTPAVGYAAWRVGPADGDVIAHSPNTREHTASATTRGFAYHAWLTYEDFIIDFTTYQLRRKAQALDELDQGHTTVAWCPEFLLLPATQVHSYRDVIQAPGPGLAYYEARADLAAELRSGFILDEADLQAARLIMRHPEAVVCGPNQLEP